MDGKGGEGGRWICNMLVPKPATGSSIIMLMSLRPPKDGRRKQERRLREKQNKNIKRSVIFQERILSGSLWRAFTPIFTSYKIHNHNYDTLQSLLLPFPPIFWGDFLWMFLSTVATFKVGGLQLLIACRGRLFVKCLIKIRWTFPY